LLPLGRLFGAQRDLCDFWSRRCRSDAAEIDLLDPETICGSKDGADIGEAPDVVQYQKQIGPPSMLATIGIRSVLIDPSFSKASVPPRVTLQMNLEVERLARAELRSDADPLLRLHQYC